MLTPAVVNVNPVFFPLGNTPAASLTQTIPPGEPVDVLLLGCGDVRHILFTGHVDAARTMDITCCDVEKAVLARNILLLSLLIDGNDFHDDFKLIWNLYYHMKLDGESLELLYSQAEKLVRLSATMDTWQQSKYGPRLRYCDTATLEDVRSMWEFYAIKRNDAEAESFKLRFDDIVESQKALQRDDRILQMFRSAFPAFKRFTFSDLNDLHSHYWEHGSLKLDDNMKAQQIYPNPMFLKPEDDAIIYDGTNPLIGFHLALAGVPLEAQNPLSQTLNDLSMPEKIVATAMTELRDWAASYKKHNGNMTLRFITADASNLAHMMQQSCRSGINNAGLYRQQYDPRPLVLNDVDYITGKAPLVFDIIDTPNLCDHIGSLVLLVAVAPLLRNSLSSVLYTEVMVTRNRSPKEILEDQLCGDVPTLSSILGLPPIEHWTNVSPLSVHDEKLISAPRRNYDGTVNDDTYLRTSWKRSIWLLSARDKAQSCVVQLPKMRFNAQDLAIIIYDVYLRMFRIEDCQSLMKSTLSRELMQNFACVWYQRAGFASVVQLFKTHVDCDWEEAMAALLELVINRSDCIMKTNSFQELSVYLHIFGTHSNGDFLNWHRERELYSLPGSIYAPALNETPQGHKWGDLRDWKEIPSVVCITLKVPKSCLRVFTQDNSGMVGAPKPAVHCTLRDSGSERIFSACHLVFGDVRTEGEKHTGSFEVYIEPDKCGWNGSAALMVSFLVSTYCLLQSPRKTEVGFGVLPTFKTAMDFLQDLGPSLMVYKTTLDNDNNVFVTQHSPNQARFPNSPGLSEPEQGSIENLNERPVDAFIMAQSRTQTRIVSMTGRVEIKSGNYQSALINRSPVRAKMMSAYQVEIILGEEPPLILGFPTMVNELLFRTTDSQESHSFEVLVEVPTSSEWERCPDFMYPVHWRKGGPVNWNLTYIDLGKCPIVDSNQTSRLQWLKSHVAGCMSERERHLRQNTNLTRTTSEKIRLQFKEAIFGALFNFADRTRCKGFGLTDHQTGSLQVLIFPSSLRMDLSTRTVVLDCAVLSLHEDTLNQLLDLLIPIVDQGLLAHDVKNRDLQLWKHALSASVERCRKWTHKENCEYATVCQVPLTLEYGKKFMCTCGNGKFPEDFMPGLRNWDLLSKYAVRAAISPPFWAPFVEDISTRTT
ncbi:hypothetical protein F5Y14DRAFT_421401 [Nemania sp. NC0429]|nr:hypothetical protein F5Y14DRAFT_421401 [Nemania sp. NC0429]